MSAVKILKFEKPVSNGMDKPEIEPYIKIPSWVIDMILIGDFKPTEIKIINALVKKPINSIKLKMI